MIDDMNERLEEIQRLRKQNGLKQVWVTQRCVEYARNCVSRLKELDIKATMPEVIELALQDFIGSIGAITQSDIDEIVSAIEMEEKRG